MGFHFFFQLKGVGRNSKNKKVLQKKKDKKKRGQKEERDNQKN